MRIASWVRGASLGLSLCAVAWPTSAGATDAPPPARARAKAASSPAASPAKPGFTIEPFPAWVRPLPLDSARPPLPAPYQIVLADEQVRVQPGGTVRFARYVRQINETSALAQGGQVGIEFDPTYQRLVLHRVDILRGNQRIAKLDARKVRVLVREPQLERQVIDGRVTASLVLDDLRVGDRVDWAVSVIGDNPVFGGRFVYETWDAYGNGPIGSWQLRLLVPAARAIQARVGDPAVTSTTTVHDGERDTIYRRDGAAQLSYEDHLPPSEFLPAQLEFSEFRDWKDVAAWGEQLFARAMQPTPAVDAQVAALKAGAATPEALLRATLDFVQRDIRYFGTETGAESHQPAPAEVVLRQRFGDCKDKAALLATLLVRMGFDAAPVLVSAQYTDASAQRLPGPLAFDHAIVRVMVDGKPLWLDATRSLQTGRVASREALDLGWGLVARTGEELTALPSSRDTIHVETTDTFSFSKLSQEGTMQSVSVLHGDSAEWFRQGLASQPRDVIEKFVTAETIRANPSLVATAPMTVETETEDNTVRVTTHYRTGDYWTLPEQRALLGRFALEGVMAPLRLPDQTTRTRPYRFAMAGRYVHHVAFELGEPAAGDPHSSHFDETNAVFDLHVRGESSANHRDVTGELHLLQRDIAAADWPAHREKVTKVAPQLMGNFVLLPLGPAQYEQLRTQGPLLVTRLRSGQEKVATSVQAEARIRLLALDLELASDRLPPKLRAQVLLAQGVALDDVGRDKDARAAFEAALPLAPADADLHEALAVNAFSRADDATALQEIGETLRLSPARGSVLLLRGYSHLLAGDAAAARDDLLVALQSREEVERSYGALWLYLATRRLGGDAVKAIEPYAPTALHPPWPYGVVELMQGRSTLEAALVDSRENGQRSPSRECELYFFAGEKAAADGDLARARKYLRLSVATGVTEFIEYHAATRELARLGER